MVPTQLLFDAELTVKVLGLIKKKSTTNVGYIFKNSK